MNDMSKSEVERAQQNIAPWKDWSGDGSSHYEKPINCSNCGERGEAYRTIRYYGNGVWLCAICRKQAQSKKVS